MKVALIGFGRMGQHLARRLADLDIELSIFSRRLEKRSHEFPVPGRIADSPAAAVDGASIIISIVSDDKASKQIWLGEKGAIFGRHTKSAIAIECSTISVAWCKELHSALTDRGLRFIDSPMNGGVKGAKEGTLTLFIGANKDDLDKASQILLSFSNKIIHFGGPGTGTAFKLILNLMIAAQSSALAEALALARNAGLNNDEVCAAITSSGIFSRQINSLMNRMLSTIEVVPNFTTSLMHKDTTYAIAMARSMGLTLPVSESAYLVYRDAVRNGFAERDHSSIIQYICNLEQTPHE